MELIESTRLEADVGASPHRYRAIFDALGDALILHDAASGSVLEVNQKTCELFDYSPEEARQLKIAAFWGEEPAGPPAMEMTAAAGTAQAVARRVKDRTGRHFWAEVSLRPLVLDGRDQILTVIRDLAGRRPEAAPSESDTGTHRQEAQAALKESQERFQQLADNIDAVFWMKPLDGPEVLYINSAYERIWGRSVQSLVEHPETWVESIHPEDLPVLLERGFPNDWGEHEFRIFRPDGEMRWINVRTFPVPNENGEAGLVAGISVDITPRRRFEEALQESEARYRFVTEGSLAGVYLIQDGKFRYVNPVMAKAFGYTPEEIIDVLGPLDLVHPEDRARVGERIRRRLAGEEGPAHYGFTGLRKDGTPIYCEVLSRFVEYQGAKAIMGTLLDITERRQAEEALKASEAKYRTIFGAGNDAISVIDPENGDLLEVNRRVLEITGYRETDGPLNISDLCSRDAPYTALDAWKWLRKAMEEGPQLFEWLAEDRAGRRFWVEISLKRTLIGGRERLLGVVRDISERKQVEEIRRKAFEEMERRVEARTAWLKASNGQLLREIEDRQRAEEMIRLQRDLGLALSGDVELKKALKLCLETAITISGMDSGGVYLVDPNSGSIELRFHQGLSLKFIQKVLHFDADSINALLVNAGEPVYARLQDQPGLVDEASLQEEGLRSAAIIPVVHQGRVIACLNVASHKHEEVPETARVVLETIAAQVGSAIARIKAEEALRESQERFQAFMDHLPGISFMMNNDNRLVYLNRNLETIFQEMEGLKISGNFLGKSNDEIWAPELAAELNAENLMVLMEQKPRQFVQGLRQADGQHLWLVNKFPIMGEDGAPLLVGGIGIDITELKEAEEALRQAKAELESRVAERTAQLSRANAALQLELQERQRVEASLRESEAKYRALVEQIPAITYLVPLDGPFHPLYISPHLQEILGFSTDEWLAGDTSCARQLHADDRERVLAERAASRAGSDPFISEYRMVTKSGRIVWLRDESRVVRDNSGKPLLLQGLALDITRRKEAEEALRESEARYRTLVEQIPAITFIAALDDVQRHLYVSPQLESVLGFTPGEWLADPELFKKQIHPEDRDRVLSELLLSYSQGGPFSSEYRMLSKDGRMVWIRDESRAVYDRDGRPLLMQGVALDITAHKQAEEVLQTATAKLRALVQAAPLAIIAIDTSCKVSSWNPAAERIFGWRENEVLGRPMPQVPGDRKKESQGIIRRILAGETIRGLEVRRRRKDGALIDVSLSSAVLQDATGKITGIMGVMEDITARKQTEEALRESEARYRAIFEDAAVGMARMDLQGQTYESNPALQELLGYSSEELRRVSYADVTYPDDLAADMALFTELVAGKRNSYQLEKRYIRKDGQTVWGRLSVSLVRDAAENPQFAISMVEDITERKRAEAVADAIRRQQEAILNNIADIAWLKDRESRFIIVNEAFGKACGLRPGDLVGKTDLDIWPRTLAQNYRQDDFEVMKTGNKKRVEEPLADKEGNISWIETIKSPIFNDRHEIIGTTGVARDITARRSMEETLRKVSRALKAITECHQAMLRASRESELLEEVCRIIVEVGGYRMAWVGQANLDAAKSVLPVAQTGCEEGYLQTVNVTWADTARGRGPVGTAIRTGKPAICRDTQKDPRFAPWRREALKRGYASVLGLPLKASRTFGALAIYAAAPNAFDDEEINLLIGLTNDLAYGITALRTMEERRKAEEALKDSEQKLRLLTSQLLSVQERERRRIARELHDELGQALTVLKIQLVAIENRLRTDQGDLKAGCEQLLGYIDGVIENVRRLSWDLSPYILEDLGLLSSLRSLIAETCHSHNIQSSVQIDKIDHLFSSETKINIYRLFQESLTNIVRHAQASQIEVAIKKQGDKVSFMVQDNGRGFDKEKVLLKDPAQRGLGLTAMKERALMAHGSLNIWSRQGGGTKVTFTIPIVKRGKR